MKQLKQLWNDKSDKLKKLISIGLLIVTIVNFVGTAIPMVQADSLLGTNKALGSPILNQGAVSDDWNKYESAVWGIFLSNFCVPFLDDYESAFNLSSGHGSNGRGLSALSFSAGSDVSNTQVLQDLVTYAIRTQGTSVKRVRVSFVTMRSGRIVCADNFGENKVDSSVTDTYTAAETRSAVLKDLFPQIESYKSTDSSSLPMLGHTWIGKDEVKNIDHTINISSTDGGLSMDLNTYTYPLLRGCDNWNMPVLAVESGASNEIVYNFANPYDIEMFCGALAYALGSDYAKEVKEFLNDSSNLNKPLYIDSFGNLCVQDGSRYIVIVPGSANQYLTKTRKLNLLNSMVFNAGNTSDNKVNLILNAGSDSTSLTFLGKNVRTSATQSSAGGVAFNNGSTRTRSSGMAIFYDTDNIAFQEKGTGTYGSYRFDTGKLMNKLFDAKAGDSNGYNLKIEPMNIGSDLFDGLNGSLPATESLTTTNMSESIEWLYTVSATVANLMSQPVTDRLTYLHDFTASSTQDDEIQLFENSVVIPVETPEGQESSGKANTWGVYRLFMNYIYSKYTTGEYNATIRNAFMADNPGGVLTQLVTGTKGYSDLALDFISEHSRTNPVLYSKNSSLSDAEWKNAMNNTTLAYSWDEKAAGSEFIILNDIKNNGNATTQKFSTSSLTNWLGLETANAAQRALLASGRLIKLFYTSDVLEHVSSVLGIRDGTAFYVYAPNIYYTYLKWYGLKKNINGTFSADFNDKIINDDVLIEEISEVTNMQSAEDKEKAILNYAYLSLHPTAGREYRNKLMMSKLSSLIYTQYQRIVYGGSDTYYYSTVTTKNNTGFLYVPNYSENFTTAWFMQYYSKIAIVLIGVGTILTIIVALLRKRKITWVLLGITLVVNVVLVLPATGEIVPYVSNELVQEIFDNNMTFWSVSELASTSASSASQVKQRNNTYLDSLSEAEAQQVNRLVNSLKSIYLDRYLSIKQDISNKVIQDSNNNYDEIQEFKSARWLLPMIMRQWTNNEGTADYVYVTLGDKLEDACNIYCYFAPEAAKFVGAFNDAKDATTVTSFYNGGVHRNEVDTNPNNYYEPFESIAYSTNDANTDENHYKARSLVMSSSINPVHTCFYILPFEKFEYDIEALGRDGHSYKEWARETAENVLTSYAGSALKEAYNGGHSGGNKYSIAEVMTKYNRYTMADTYQNYGYLWMTESPLTYFYINTVETFTSDGNLGTLANSLLGEYLVDATTGQEYRSTIMVSEINHKVLDILDLETMFKNVIPYLYSVQLAAGGYDGESGQFNGALIGNTIPIYEDNDISWIFRSNWVTKIMENSDYNSQAVIYDKDGTKYTVDNQMLPGRYPAERPMVFSEAQMVANGLSEEDLSYVELKCVELNKTIYRKWTLMVNYLGLDGMSREVMFRQMAIDSTIEFCKEFDYDKFTTPKNRMYPTSLDLRSISFDSVMKMLMLNVTKNTSYIFGDSMDVLIDDSDILSQTLLIICAALCVKVIPFIRCIALGLMFYLGYASVIKTLFKDAKEKVETSVGYTGCNILMLLTNIGYLLLIRLIMSMTNSDQVLNLNNASISVGNPDWCFFFVIISSCLYILGCILIIKFCFQHFKDMGFSVFKGVMDMAADNISTGFEKIIGKMGESSEVGKASNSEDAPTRAIQNPVNQGGSDGADSSGGSGGSGRSGGSSGGSTDSSSSTTMETNASYEHESEEYHVETSFGSYRFVDNDADEINDIIHRGKDQEKDETEQSTSGRRNETSSTSETSQTTDESDED